MAVENNPTPDTPAPKDTPLRQPDGKFASQDARKVMDPGADNWNYEDAPVDIDPATDPLLSETPGKDLPAFGFPEQPDSEDDADDQPQPQGAKVKGPPGSRGAEASAESEDSDEPGDEEDGDVFLAGLVERGLRATEADDDSGAESGSGRATEAPKDGGDDAATLALARKIGKSNPELAAQILQELVGVGEGKATPARSKKSESASRDLRKVWEEAVREGKDFDGIIEITREIVKESLAPVTKAAETRQKHEQFVRAKVEEFEEFKRKYPGWVQYRKQMGAVLEEISKDVGAAAAANIKPERLLFLAAPGFHRESVKAAAAKAALNKKAATAARLTPPASQKAGGSGAPTQKAGGSDQDNINRTVQRLTRESRIKNFI